MKNWRETMMRRTAKGKVLRPVCVARLLNDMEEGETQAEMEISGIIGGWGEELGEISADMVKAQLSGLTAKRLLVRLDSPGGDVFEGTKIFNAFKEYSGRVVMRVTGLAASVTSVIAMAGNRIEMLEGTWLMIHRAWTIAVGNSKDMLDLAQFLETIDEEIARIYTNRTGGKQNEILDWMTAETWMNPAQAVEHGFADAAIEASPKTASAQAQAFDLTVFGYEKVPEGLQGPQGLQGQQDTDTPEEPKEGDNPAEWPVEDALRLQRLEAAKARLKFKTAGGVTC